MLVLGPRQPQVHAYIICVRVQEIADRLITGLHMLLEDLAFDLKREKVLCSAHELLLYEIAA